MASRVRPRVPGLGQHKSSPEELPQLKARGGGQEELPHVRGAVAARVPEGLEELFHVQGHEGQLWGDTPRPGKEQWLGFAGAAMKR